MLEAHNVTFGYVPSLPPLFQSFSLAIAPGERVALHAPSGFGKTTLCRVLAGFEHPWEGEVLVDDAPLPQPPSACPVQLIGQHPEQAVDPRLRMERTLTEAGSINTMALDRLGIQSAWLHRYPHELSGGELQRFCIARAIAVRPRYLIADEITTMLDAVTQALIWQFLLTWQQRTGAGLIFVTHSDALRARLATRVVDLTQVMSPNE